MDDSVKQAVQEAIIKIIKYNGDHDTGKFVDINRKFIKTYAGLVNHLDVTDTQLLSKTDFILLQSNPSDGGLFILHRQMSTGVRNSLTSFLKQSPQILTHTFAI